MSNFRLSRGLCAVVGEVLLGSHKELNALYVSAGAPGEPPDLAHDLKWKEWLFRAGTDEGTDSLAVLGNIIEEFMDVKPVRGEDSATRDTRRERIETALTQDGLQYFRGGRVIPNGSAPTIDSGKPIGGSSPKIQPNSLDELLQTIVNGLPRAMHPLTHRRKGSIPLQFDSEYDIQDLLHALLRPWIADIRPEEFSPSHAGSNTRMDFLLPKYNLVIETKRVRDKSHARKIGQELVIDIAHYGAHPRCTTLWCVIYDPDGLLENPGGLVSDLEGETKNSNGSVNTVVKIVTR